MIDLRRFLLPERILFLRSATKAEALAALIEQSRLGDDLRDFDRFRKEIVQREGVLTTGIGQGVAVPHVRSDSVRRFFVTVGVFAEGVDWDSLDGKPVYVAFLVAGPQDHAAYLQILAALTRIIRDGGRRRALIAARSPQEVLQQLSDI